MQDLHDLGRLLLGVIAYMAATILLLGGVPLLAVLYVSSIEGSPSAQTSFATQPISKPERSPWQLCISMRHSRHDLSQLDEPIRRACPQAFFRTASIERAPL
jgi:hypothetical protein